MSQYDDPGVVNFENARGRDWQEHEDEYLLEYGARATADWANRSLASCRSRLQRLRSTGSDGEAMMYGNDDQQVHRVGVVANEPIDMADVIERHKRQFKKIHKSHERKHHQHVYLPGALNMITFFSDQHIGSPHTDLERMLDEQKAVMSLPNSYVALGGDTVDNYVIGKLAAQNMHHHVTVGEEWQIAEHYMQSFSDRLLWVHSGNHAQWSTKMIGVDVDRSITPDGVLYDADEILVNVHMGPHSFMIRSRHKWSGNSIHNATHGMERAARFDNSAPDIFIGAHVHKGAIVRNFIVGGQRKTAILTGTYKGGSDTYARQEGFIANNGSTGVSIIFFPDGSYHAFDSIPAACQVMRALTSRAA